MSVQVNNFIVRKSGSLFYPAEDFNLNPILYVEKKNNFQLLNVKPLPKDIHCELIDCGCRINSFIWVSHKKKAIYFENPKAASSSIKKSLSLRHPDLSNILIQLYIEWINVKDFSIIIRDYFGTLNEELINQTLLKVNETIKTKSFSMTNLLYITHYSDNNDFELFYGNREDVLNVFPDYYSFSFIRDPVDRFLSNYRMFVQKDARYKQLITLNKRQNEDLKLADFISLAKKYPNHHWEPQYKFLPVLKNKKTLSYLGNTSFFNDEWPVICRELNIDCTINALNTTEKDIDIVASIPAELINEIKEMYSEDYLLIKVYE